MKHPAYKVLPALLLALVTHWGSWNQGFVWDDQHQIVHGQLIKDLSNLPTLFVTDTWSNVAPRTDRRWAAANSYRPLQNASFMVSWALFGDQATGYHVENTLYHLLCVLLLFLLWGRLRGSPDEAAWAAGLFAVLPVNVEAVAWVAGRADMQISALLMGAFLAYLKLREAEQLRSAPVPLGLMLGCSFCALLIKESAIVLPGLLLVYELFLAEPPINGRRVARHIALLLVPLFIYGLLRSHALDGARLGISAIQPARLALDIVPIAATYLSWVLVPQTLTVGRPWESMGLSISLVLGSLALAVLAGLLISRLQQRGRGPRTFGLAWFVVAISPAVLFTHLSGEMGERYTYLPALGICGWLGLEMHNFVAYMTLQGGKRRARILMGVVMSLLWLRAAVRVEDWESDITLYLAAIQDQPSNPEAYYRLGTQLASDGEVHSASEALSTALHLRPGELRYANNLAVVLLRRGRPAAAREVLLGVLPRGDQDPRLQLNLGLSEAALGHTEVAEQRYRRALALRPGYALARAQLAKLQRRREADRDAKAPSPPKPVAPAPSALQVPRASPSSEGSASP